MRMVRNVVMALAVVASASIANADSFAWFTTGNTAGNGAAGPAAGAQGSNLALTCDTSLASPCSWVITGRLNRGAGLLGFNFSLGTAPGNGVSSGNGTYMANPPYASLPSGGTGGTGAALLTNVEGQAASNPAAGQNDLVQFTLTRSFVAGDLSPASISLSVPTSANGIEWFNGNSFAYEMVGFGANPLTNTETYPVTAGTVISIQNVPEPTSLGLLAMGALGLLRRRR